tara:strand:+ start:9516 stop:11081 length:1566 start_codon:yes stop_codon:yes gene_type:complete
MTVSSTNNIVTYAGNGSTTVFAYTFKTFAASDLVVIERTDSTGAEVTKTLTTHYTVSGAGTDSGGNVTFGSAPASGVTVVIQRSLDLTQAIDYVENDPFPAESHEEGLDRAVMRDQQIKEELSRSIRFPVGDSGVSSEIPSATERANKFLSFNSSGVPTATAADLTGSFGLSEMKDDLTPQLGGNLDLNSKNITGSGNIDTTGTAAISGNTTVGGTLGITGTTTAAAINASGNIGGVNLTASGTLNVTGNTTLTGSLTADGLAYPTTDGSAGQFLKTDGSGTLSFGSVATSDAGLQSMQVFTSNGTYTRPTGITKVKVTVIGGGGGGGGSRSQSGNGETIAVAGGGGGGGATAIKIIDVSSISSTAVTVGPVGSAGPSSGGNGGTGGTSKFGGDSDSHQVTAAGGAPGGGESKNNTGIANKAGGSGGSTTSGATLSIVGSDGSPGVVTTNSGISGQGGASFMGGGGAGSSIVSTNSSSSGLAGNNFGGGGSGGISKAEDGATHNAAGGAGSAGVVIVEEFA